MSRRQRKENTREEPTTRLPVRHSAGVALVRGFCLAAAAIAADPSSASATTPAPSGQITTTDSEMGAEPGGLTRIPLAQRTEVIDSAGATPARAALSAAAASFAAACAVDALAGVAACVMLPVLVWTLPCGVPLFILVTYLARSLAVTTSGWLSAQRFGQRRLPLLGMLAAAGAVMGTCGCLSSPLVLLGLVPYQLAGEAYALFLAARFARADYSPSPGRPNWFTCLLPAGVTCALALACASYPISNLLASAGAGLFALRAGRERSANEPLFNLDLWSVPEGGVERRSPSRPKPEDTPIDASYQLGGAS